MAGDYTIQGSTIFSPTLKRAEKLVPPEFHLAWRRFQEYGRHDGEGCGRLIPRLPRADEDMCRDLPIKLASQRGIHSPNYSELPSHGAGKRKYALSVHSEGQRVYGNADTESRGDGTWVLEYKAHVTSEGKRATDNSTTNLMNCLEDGVPVGVMVKSGKGYEVLGLAFVEQYNSLTDSFMLHGPVTAATEANNCFLAVQPEELTPAEKNTLMELESTSEPQADDRIRVFTERVQREQQGRFRSLLLDAYEGACAISDVDVPDVLQAAHIDPYRGRHSQLVTNGILMRADMHLLYDRFLISVEPDYTIHVSKRLAGSEYARFNRRKLRLPDDYTKVPDPRRLDFHYKHFRAECAEL